LPFAVRGAGDHGDLHVQFDEDETTRSAVRALLGRLGQPSAA
jgi:hypothetical protein